MSVWSVALDRQVDLWRHCQPYASFEELREHAWELTNLDGEVATPDEIIGDTTMQALFFQILKTSPQTVALYYFSSETCQLLKQARDSYPLGTPAPPETCFLSDMGFWYFADPVLESDSLDVQHRPLRMLLWHRSHTHRLVTFIGLLDDAKAPLPLIFGTWPDSHTIRQSLEEFDVTMDGNPDERAVRVMMQLVMQHFGATISFCHQRVFLDRREPADRAARRRAEAQGIVVASDVHVMVLRRPVAHVSDEARDVDWHWRWWVRGHWRQQPVGPGRQDRVPVFIAPYVKGPEDRPMKPMVPSVYAVTR